MIQTVEVGAWIGSTATGRASDHPGGRTANVAASVPDVRQPGEANTSVNMSIMGSRQYRPPVSGAVRTIGPLLRSRNAEEYSVSKLGRTTVCKSAGGSWRKWQKVFVGACPGTLPASTLVACRRVTSIDTKG